MLFCNLKKSKNSNNKKGAEKSIYPKRRLDDILFPFLIIPFLKFKNVEKVSMIDAEKDPLLASSQKNICKIASCSASSGSVTLECACIVPLFMFFCVQMLSILSLFSLHSCIEAAMHQEVSQAAVRLYAVEKAENGFGVDCDNINKIVTNLGLAGKIKKRIGNDYLNRSLIDGGSSGLHIAVGLGAVDKQDTVDITLSYRVKPLVDMLGFSGFTMANRCRMKIWSGYDIADEESKDRDSTVEEMVYVAENGIVYHLNANCSYLNPSITSISKAVVGNNRNRWGEKYYPCEICGKTSMDQIYITEQGNRYHCSSRCSGLKRTVSRILLSEALQRGLGPCSRCG